MKPVTITELRAMKGRGERIAALTAYDYSFAAALDAAGVDIVLVGDSAGMTVQGHPTTLPVTMDQMVYHTQCVARGVRRALIVADMPFLSFQESPALALRIAGRLMQEGGAHVVKLEGGAEMAETVRFLVARGIPVCGHVGLTPQSVHELGGYRLQGRGVEAEGRIEQDCRALEDAGAAVIVLEMIPAGLARRVTAMLQVPTIGIGAGPACDGQVLVLQDLLGIYPGGSPKFSRNFLRSVGSIAESLQAYVAAVKNGSFPGPGETPPEA